MRRFRVCRTHNEDRGEVCRPLREAAGSILGSAVGWGVEGESCAGQSSFSFLAWCGSLTVECCPVFLCHLFGVAQRQRHTQTRARRGERSAACVPPIYTSNVRIRRDLISRFVICAVFCVEIERSRVSGERRRRQTHSDRSPESRHQERPDLQTCCAPHVTRQCIGE